jgi:hypothetical protein
VGSEGAGQLLFFKEIPEKSPERRGVPVPEVGQEHGPNTDRPPDGRIGEELVQAALGGTGEHQKWFLEGSPLFGFDDGNGISQERRDLGRPVLGSGLEEDPWIRGGGSEC